MHDVSFFANKGNSRTHEAFCSGLVWHLDFGVPYWHIAGQMGLPATQPTTPHEAESSGAGVGPKRTSFCL